ncbi:preprotein translocase subunit SecA [Candidatus Desulforudis audaxviator]|uniref:Protein translocase subunit SecA n=1 Tax=Desulforudis audaxviator (strain MP104C) TaxID=477974 RepID=SECA_DESAP|nr:preprotein translocase subunit SecA [Candidatus Desulforudis audaxviator]B1I6D8.1 RecName: Full=Protein translocase subunit SecA [Candidatus Desulforudis audaxviator MP104C]ACA60569.1 preprotein translocase, SecA subunit [Candidatus Desulforudis audaxviator MP104C]AZK60644.1 Protein export cytoplasm protein SecA ATPase RNA helicase [Candidatus Desulforudis audaxviator]
MLGFLKNFLDDNAREVKKLQRVVTAVNELEPRIEKLTDAELQAKTPALRERLEAGAPLDDLLPEAFAVVREVSRRVLDMRHFDVQIMGGVVLHQGKIAEMKTGEGKTLVATLPAYLNALTGRGVHIVTVNDYLAKRDSEWMGHIYRFLGLSTGLIVHGLDARQRQASYAADVIYGTNNEFGFDYLRDNMAMYPRDLVQRDLYYAIVDEVDSILIDEARTPLIISGQSGKPTDTYYTMARLVPKLKAETHFAVDEKARTVSLTEEGFARCEELLNIDNLSDPEHEEVLHHLNQALKAHALMKRDRDYVVKDGQVIIVDEFTGRLMFGRRYSDGLHQAIEAKEGVKIERESQTLATITFQNYFRMYEKLAGMTGTADTEAEEFKKIYGLDVVVVPTHKPMIREDLPDAVFKTEEGKFRAVVEEIAARHATGQPVLVGTISIEKSEVLSRMLTRRGIPHQVLNAKYHEKEAEIVAQAGRIGAVTIATNMAGRGTDIMLGGNPSFLALQEMRRRDYPPEVIAEAAEYGPCTEEVAEARRVYRELYAEFKKETDAEHDRVVALGGLFIIGTERHEARRIDNQLRGRCGRQGDPGATQFFVALNDDLLRLFGGDNIAGLMDRLKMDEDAPLEHPLISKSLETAQRRVENRNFSIRKHVLNYDDVINQQRELIYRQRRQVLCGEDLRPVVRQMMEEVAGQAVTAFAPEGVYPEEWNYEGLSEYMTQILPGEKWTVEDLEERLGKKRDDFRREDLRRLFLNEMEQAYAAREAELGAETMREIERVLMLRIVDEKWMDHLDAMDQLREGVGLRAYGQKDPLVEYKFESFDMFQNMIASIQEETVKKLFRVRVVPPQQAERRQVKENLYAAGGDGVKQPVRRDKKVGRNSPCPCGSGKKYKKCCAAKDEQAAG